jgi:hypothetical protein
MCVGVQLPPPERTRARAAEAEAAEAEAARSQQHSALLSAKQATAAYQHQMQELIMYKSRMQNELLMNQDRLEAAQREAKELEVSRKRR